MQPYVPTMRPLCRAPWLAQQSSSRLNLYFFCSLIIVVMSAGNTPIIDMNIFNGLRALSATIAVELPEAVKDGTLYRILFLSGLVLFAMTFVINTVAEIIRLRFRKRAMQL